jgi:protein involved in sex pheromone biosynthesis
MKNIILIVCVLFLAGCINSENSNEFRQNMKQALSGASAQIQQQRQQQLDLYKTVPPFSNKSTHCTTQYSGNMAYTNCN